MNKVITKYNGEKAVSKSCRKIKNEFYEKNIDCFLIDGKWNRINNGLIFYDYRDCNWKRKANYEIVKGFIDETSNLYEMVYDESTIRIGSQFILNNEVALKRGFKESINSEKIIKASEIEKKGIKDSYGPLKYSLGDSVLRRLHSEYEDSFKDEVKNDIFLSKFLRNYTFGLEFETSNGYIRKSKLRHHGVIPLLDGSLRKDDGLEPFEFTTVPYQGLKGVTTIESFVDVLNVHCEIDLTCSLHIHIGNFKVNTNSKIVSTYKLFQDIQDDMFKMFPRYKLKPSLIDKSKNYCKLLQPIDFSPLGSNKGKISTIDYYASHIFTSLTGKTMDQDNNFAKSIGNMSGTSKWNIPGRYTWVNLISLLLNNRRTVEFRIHEPTLDKTHVVNWLLFNISILDYITNNESHILQNKVTLEDIFKYSDYGNGLRSYYKDRCNFYSKMNNENDYYSLYNKPFKII
jgi:hypothetical protein